MAIFYNFECPDFVRDFDYSNVLVFQPNIEFRPGFGAFDLVSLFKGVRQIQNILNKK